MKKIVSLLAVSFSLFSLFAVDFGALVASGTSSKFKGDSSDPEIKQTETFTGSVKVPFNNEGTMYFAAEGSIQHKLEVKTGDDDSTDDNVIGDVTLFKCDSFFKLSNSAVVEVAAGRFTVTDSTEIVFSQPADGILAKFVSPAFEVSLYGGYTGLQNYKNVSILDSDGRLIEIEKDDEKDFYDFAAPYEVFSASVTFPYFAFNQSVGFESLVAIESKGPRNLSDGINSNPRFYGTAVLSGPFTTSLFYTLTGCVEKQNFTTGAFLGKFNLNWFMPVMNGSLAWSTVYATGRESDAESFVGFTKSTVCNSADDVFYSGALKSGISASIVPVKPLFLSTGADVVFTNPDGRDYLDYKGTQINATAKLQCFSDLSVALTYSSFVAKETESNQNEISLNITLAL